MVGKFVNVNKRKVPWCFIEGSDGNNYFFHKANLKDSHDWKYVWNGNECAFDVGPSKDPSLKLPAINVVPNPTVNSKQEISQENHKKNLIKKEFNVKRRVIIKRNSEDIQRHLYYTIVKKRYQSDESFLLVEPVIVWKDKNYADERLYFLKNEHFHEYTYLIRKCLVYRSGQVYLIRELDKNKIGREIYRGVLSIVD